MKKSKVVGGIILLILAIVIIIGIFAPNFDISNIKVWKLILSALIFYWIIDKIISGNTLAKKLDIFFPLAIGLWIFENEIETALGINFNIWLVLLAGLLLHISFELMFGDIRIKKKRTTNEHEDSYSYHMSKFKNSEIYLDATKPKHIIKSSFGNTEVYFQNLDIINAYNTIELEIDNSFGHLEVHIPDNWDVEDKISNNLGSIDIRESKQDKILKLKLTGENRFGQVEIV